VAEEMNSRVERSIEESLAVKRALLEDKVLVSLIAGVAAEFVRVLRQGHKILLFGNGGSAADAQHIAAEFVGRFQLDRPPIPALALTVDSSLLTSIANDSQYENVFARQIEALGLAGDIALGISTSGRSPNVLRGFAAAKGKRMLTVALTGKNGGQLSDRAQYCICVPSESTARVQEAHILIGHILAEIAEAELVSK
jgi:D-sedoheptulose 7-phosphate isomerase